FAVRQPPPGILAGETSDHRIGAAGRQRPRPPRRCPAGNEIDRAQAAHADLGDAQTGRNAAEKCAAGVDDGFAELAAADPDAQRGRLDLDPFDQRGGARIHAEGGGLAHATLSYMRPRTASILHKTRRFARSAVAAAAVTVHSGSPALRAMPACGRSAVQSGQAKGGTDGTSRSAWTMAEAAAPRRGTTRAGSAPPQASTCKENSDPPAGPKMSRVAPGRGLISKSQTASSATRKSPLFSPPSGTATTRRRIISASVSAVSTVIAAGVTAPP